MRVAPILLYRTEERQKGLLPGAFSFQPSASSQTDYMSADA